MYHHPCGFQASSPGVLAHDLAVVTERPFDSAHEYLGGGIGLFGSFFAAVGDEGFAESGDGVLLASAAFLSAFDVAEVVCFVAGEGHEVFGLFDSALQIAEVGFVGFAFDVLQEIAEVGLMGEDVFEVGEFGGRAGCGLLQLVQFEFVLFELVVDV
jgi:hypothetical protein